MATCKKRRMTAPSSSLLVAAKHMMGREEVEMQNGKVLLNCPRRRRRKRSLINQIFGKKQDEEITILFAEWSKGWQRKGLSADMSTYSTKDCNPDKVLSISLKPSTPQHQTNQNSESWGKLNEQQCLNFNTSFTGLSLDMKLGEDGKPLLGDNSSQEPTITPLTDISVTKPWNEGRLAPNIPNEGGGEFLPCDNCCRKLCYKCKQKLTKTNLRLNKTISNLDEKYDDDEIDLLPAYREMIPNMFYCFAGISQYSNDNTKMSKEDFFKLLSCIGLSSLAADLLACMSIHTEQSVGQGIITIDMFSDLFSSDFARVLVESRMLYEDLCSAILTMKRIDKGKINRLVYEQFTSVYKSLHPDSAAEEIKAKFDYYDTDGVGFLTIENLFYFCHDQEQDDEECNEEEESEVEVSV